MCLAARKRKREREIRRTPTKFRANHIDTATILSKEGTSWHATGFSLPANFTNLFTDRYSSDRGATHKSGLEWGEGGGEAKTRGRPRYYTSAGANGLRVRRMRLVSQRSGKLIPICRPGVKGCRKYISEHLLGARFPGDFEREPLRAPSRADSGGFRSANAETRRGENGSAAGRRGSFGIKLRDIQRKT